MPSPGSSLLFLGRPAFPFHTLAGRSFRAGRTWLLALAASGAVAACLELSATAAESAKVSFYRDVRPILQANCQGCHQPAKAKGGYVMTQFKGVMAGGDSEGAAVVAGKPDQSALVKMVLPKDGEVRMPKGKSPLN